MLLNIFNRLINNKKNNEVQSFIKELNEEINSQKNNIQNTSRKEKSLIQELLEQNKLTTSYRDKMHVERSHILQSYADETAKAGTMYYIYNKDDDEIDMYHLCMCDKANINKVIKIQGKDLPEGAGVDSVLRIDNEKYILDTEATNTVYEKMESMVEQLLQEQTKEIEARRIEGHLYEVVEISSKNITLIDTTKDANNGECFEELIDTKEKFQNTKEGDIFQYINGEYVRWKDEKSDK